MKKTILILFTLAFIVGCKEKEGGDFNVQPDLSAFSFTPVAGGAIMSYALPDNDAVYGVKVEYTTATGNEVIMIGTYGDTELVLKGFIEAESAVSAKVSLLGFNNKVSKPIGVTFPTLPATTLALFDDISVESFWSGFKIEFEAPENADGFINVGYMGIDPITLEPGVLFKETKTIKPGENKLLYSNISNGEEITAVIWTEDFTGHEVHRETYKVFPLLTKKYDSSKMSYTGNSLEVPHMFLGAEYLFDGDTKGIRKMRAKGTGSNIHYHFMTNDQINMQPSGILDLDEEQYVASFRLYTLLNMDIGYSSYWTTNAPESNMANYFKIYASNDKTDWVEIGEFFQSPTLDEKVWWCFPMINPLSIYRTVAELEAADPAYAEVNFDVMDTTFRYLRVEFLATFYPGWNTGVAAVEMEVYVKN